MTRKIYSRNKTQKNRVLGTLFVLLFTGLSFFVILNVADFISSTLMNKSSLFYGGNVRTNGYVMYGMCFYQVSGKPEADALSKSIQSQGGAGYVNHQGDYFIYASMYSSFADATSVKEKLEGSANIVNISVPAVNFNYGGNPDDVVAAIERFKKIYQSLYEISISFDSGSIDLASAKNSVQDCIAMVQSDFDKIKDIKDDNVKLVAKHLGEVLEHLKTFAQQQYSGLGFNSAIKYAYFEAVFANVALAKAL